MSTLEKHFEAIDKAYESLMSEFTGGCMWPAPYNEDTDEALYKFLTECCWTYDDTEGVDRVKLIPELACFKDGKEYGSIRAMSEFWNEHRRSGKPAGIDKSRRVMGTWVVTGCCLWDMGRRVGTTFEASQDYEDSCKLIYRALFMYEQLCKRRPEFGLKPAKYLQFAGPQAIKELYLPNGSRFVPLTGRDPDTFRQEGASHLLCDEIAHWSMPEESWSNAVTMCQGKGGQAGGLAFFISSSSASVGYDEIVGL